MTQQTGRLHCSGIGSARTHTMSSTTPGRGTLGYMHRPLRGLLHMYIHRVATLQCTAVCAGTWWSEII